MRFHEDWRHFDNLVWQLPTWSSAVFALVLAASTTLIEKQEALEKALHIDAIRVLAVFLTTISLVFVLLVYVLTRFRLHRVGVATHEGIEGMPGGPRTDSVLSLILFIELAVLVAAAAIAWRLPSTGATVLAAAILGSFLLTETWYLKQAKAIQSGGKSSDA